MTDEQKALEWVDADIEASEGMGDGDITQGGRKVYPLEILRTIREALEPKTVTREWLSRWERIFKTPTTYPGALLIEMIKELGHAIKEDD